MRLRVPVKGGAGLAEVTEVFPRQNELRADEFGNAIRGPLGIHRAVRKRYWFYSADYGLEAQLEYLSRLRKITEEEMTHFVAGGERRGEIYPQTKVLLPPHESHPPRGLDLQYVPTLGTSRRQYLIHSALSCASA